MTRRTITLHYTCALLCLSVPLAGQELWKPSFRHQAPAVHLGRTPGLERRPAAADNSANGSLSGFYFVRQVLLSDFNNAGQAGRSRSIIGVATFDGKGGYTFAGVLEDSKTGGKAQIYNSKGTYAAGSNGAFQMQNPIDTLDTDFGGIGAAGPAAFTASATEGPYNDLLVGIPISGATTVASVNGAYRAGYIDFLQGDMTKVRNATFTLNPNGQGGIGNVAVTGAAANLGGNSLSQTITGATYSVDPASSLGTLNLGSASASQLISGSKAFLLSKDGSMLLGGDPNGFDFLIAVRPFSGANPNAGYSGQYFYAQFADDTSNLPAGTVVNSNYGSINATGTGIAIVHQRYFEFDMAGAYDVTYDTSTPFDSTASVTGGGGVEFLGAGGQTLIAVGGGGYYTFLVGLQTQTFTGGSVFLYPTGILNGASFAPITNPIAPGEYVTIFGTNLASGVFPQAGQTLPVPFPTTLGNVQVTVSAESLSGNNHVTVQKNAPMFYVSPTQISFVVPDFGIVQEVGTATATIQVNNNGTQSNPVTLRIYAASPGIWTAGANGVSIGRVQKLPDFSLVSDSNPVKPGDNIVVYATGLGPVIPNVPIGQAAPASPLSKVTQKIYLLIDNQPATISFAGLSPGFVSLYQINATVPNGITRGAIVSLGIEVDDTFGDVLSVTTEAKIPVAQ